MNPTERPVLQHGHPIMIVSYVGKYVYLLLIPLARGFWGALQNDFYGWLASAWIDVLVLLFMTLLAFLNYYHKRFCVNESGLFAQWGVFRRCVEIIHIEKFTALTAIENFYLRPLHAAHLHIDTMAQDNAKYDFDILVTAKQAGELFALCPPQPGLIKECRPKGVYIAAQNGVWSATCGSGYRVYFAGRLGHYVL